MLDRVAALDPEPEDFAACLAAIVSEFGDPTGPTRTVASSAWQDWESARMAPEFWPWLVAEAVVATERENRPRRGRKQRGGDDVA